MWKFPHLEASTQAVSGTDTDIVGVFQDSKKKAIIQAGSHSSLLEKLEKKKVFSGEASKFEFVRFAGSAHLENVLFCGLGLKPSLTEDKMRDLGGCVWAKLVQAQVQLACIHVSSFESSPKMLRAFAEGLILGIHRLKHEKITNGKKEKKEEVSSYHGPNRIIFFTRDKSTLGHLEIELKASPCGR